ncbi:MAG: thiamine phosphate synthase [Verrucomicrobia bacterium]|jgi:thiamine-phosphate pyrophosphorylase|nr:thiamine phosphate synthase [Verrucomicrobiota bacterium]
MKPLSDCRLYAFVDTGYLNGRSPEAIARALGDGGADLIQFRAKGMPAAEIQRHAERLLAIADRAGVWFVVNDHPEVARAIGAPLCHLGQEDFFDTGFTRVEQLTRADAGPDGLAALRRDRPLQIGLSSHAPAQAARAVAAGAAYVAIGPVFATPTKPGRPAVTLDYVRWAAANVRIPWFAIGGITLANLDDVLAAGARRICVVSAILNAPDIARACREFLRRLPSPAF